MNSKQFLQIGGILVVLVGILGFINVLGPTADKSIFGSAWWFDNNENIAHLVLGIVGFTAAYFLDAAMQKYLVIGFGVLGVVVGLINIMGNTMLLGANLENPADTILHLAVGAWAFWAALKKK